MRFQSARWRSAGPRAYRAMIYIRGYVMLTELYLTKRERNVSWWAYAIAVCKLEKCWTKGQPCNDRHPWIRDALRICTWTVESPKFRDRHRRFQSACWRSAGTRAYRAMIDTRGYVILSEFVLDQEIAQSFVMSICDCSLQAGEVVDQESTVQW
jgi:hypothetical protein